MILFFILYIIFIVILLLIFLLLTSSVKFNVQKLDLTNEYQKLIYDYKITIGIYVFNRIPIWKLILTPQKLKEPKYQKILSRINIINNKKKIDIKIFNNEISVTKFISLIIKKINLEFSKFNLNIEIGTKDCLITSFAVFGVSTIISFILAKTIKKYDSKMYKYVITPIYEGNNVLKLNLNCIFNVKMVHIINIIYIYVKQERRNRNERTSNRRSYGYSHE